MTSYVSGLYNRSLNLAKVAKEIVADTYQSNSSAKEYIADIKDKLLHIDQVYLDAAKKVTQEDEDQLKSKLEYRVLNFGTRKLSSAKDTAQNGIRRLSDAKQVVSEKVSEKKRQIADKLDDKRNDIRQALIACRDQFSTTFEVKLESAKSRAAGLRSRSAIVYANAKEGLATRYSSVKARLTAGFEAAAEKLKLQEFLDAAREKFTRLRNFTAEEAQTLKDNFTKLYNYLTNKISGNEFVAMVRRGGAKAVENLKAALSFLKDTFVQNGQSIKRATSRVSKFGEEFSRKNRQMLGFMKSENKKLLNNHAKKLEVEVFYTPTESVKLVEKTKDVVGKIVHRVSGEEKPETFVANDHAKAQ